MTILRDGAPGVLSQQTPGPFPRNIGPFSQGSTDNLVTVIGIGIYATTTFRMAKAVTNPAPPVLTVKSVGNFVAANATTGVQASIDVTFDAPVGDYGPETDYLFIARNGSLEAVVPIDITVQGA